MLDLIPFLLFVGAFVGGLAFLIHGGPKKPCTCPECRPDLYEPKTAEEYDQRAVLTRARARYLDAQIEERMKETEHADVLKFIDKLRRKKNA